MPSETYLVPMEITVDARDLVRAIGNALIWSPKVAPWDHALYMIHEDRVTIITSDSIAASEETLLAEVHPPPEYPESGKASRGELEALLDRAKKAKGEVRFTYTSGVSLAYRDHLEGEDLILDDIYRDADAGDSWDDLNLSVFLDLLGDRQEERGTHQFMVNTDYLRKLAQVKAGPGIGADVWVNGNRPVFIQKGPWSRTVIQPIDRVRHAAKNGDEVLWKR